VYEHRHHHRLEVTSVAEARKFWVMKKSHVGGPASGISSVLITDPLGSDIELTEGLDTIQ
jgi:hypothetical protein